VSARVIWAIGMLALGWTVGSLVGVALGLWRERK